MGANAVPKDKLEQLYNDPNYIAERKFDGSRYCLQTGYNGGIIFTSRRESVKGGMVNKADNVPHIVMEAQLLLSGTILDGEVDVPGNKRNFKMVQGVMGSLPERAIQLQEENVKLIYKVFDILEFQGENLRDKPFITRRKLLEQCISVGQFKYIEVVEQYTDKRELYNQEIEDGAEGIMLKNLNSIYQEDKSPAKTWYKVKDKATYDGIVKGYTLGTGKYKDTVGALKVFQYVGEELVQTAEVSGMSDEKRKEFKERLDRGETFIVEFEGYGLFLDTHLYRHPTYKRERLDKPERGCVYGHS
jgi:DNA ligase-1